MARVPTIEELRQKADEARADAEHSSHPDLRNQLLAIAAEYERLAKRAEEVEERTQLRVSIEAHLSSWFKS